MRFVFGIDVSKVTSNVAIAIDGQVFNEFKITNDSLGFNQLLTQLQQVNQPEVVFEATGVYSRRLRTSLQKNNVDYVQLNPLAAKKQLDSLRPNKTDRNDARHLAETQFILNRVSTYQQDPIYQELLDQSRFYQQINADLVRDKNRLHRILQSVFPEYEQFLSCPSGKLYWQVLITLPTPTQILSYDVDSLAIKIKTCSERNISDKRSRQLAARLINLAQLSFQSVTDDSSLIDQVRYYANELLRLDALKKKIVTKMLSIAKQLPDLTILESIPGIGETTAVLLLAELGDIRRFNNANKINAFVGIDLRHYESGNFVAADHISKRGNSYARKLLYRTIGNIASAARFQPSHINDYYQKRKKQSSLPTKKIAIACVHKLIRTIYHLIIHNQFYDYAKAKEQVA